MKKIFDTWGDLIGKGFRPIEHAGKPKHFAAVGRLALFVSNEIDSPLSSLLASQIGSDESDVVRIVVGELRVGDIIKHLRLIASTRNLPADFTKKLEQLFTEIANLRTVRDRTVHRECSVKGNQFAFHNAFQARTDAAITVDFYTIKELSEFADYALRLGHRIRALGTELTPNFLAPNQQAYRAMTMMRVLVEMLLALKKSGNLKPEKFEALKVLADDARAATKEFTDKVRKLDPNFGDVQKAANFKLTKLATAITAIEVAEASLHDIPPRLRKTDRTPQPGKPRSPSRPPRT